MPEWKRICCPVDFSDFSRLAMDQAATLARHYGAALTLLHVYDVPRLTSSTQLTPEQLALAVRELHRTLEGWRREAEFLAGRPVEARPITGQAAEEILRFAREGSFDLIVMGTHGRSGFKRLVLGSIAERVVRQAPCPVLVTRHIEFPPEEPAAPPDS